MHTEWISRARLHAQLNYSQPATDLANRSAVRPPTFEYYRRRCTRHSYDESGEMRGYYGEGRCKSDRTQDPLLLGVSVVSDVDA